MNNRKIPAELSEIFGTVDELGFTGSFFGGPKNENILRGKEPTCYHLDPYKNIIAFDENHRMKNTGYALSGMEIIEVRNGIKTGFQVNSFWQVYYRG
jgi:hypothetical protein